MIHTVYTVPRMYEELRTAHVAVENITLLLGMHEYFCV